MSYRRTIDFLVASTVITISFIIIAPALWIPIAQTLLSHIPSLSSLAERLSTRESFYASRLAYVVGLTTVLLILGLSIFNFRKNIIQAFSRYLREVDSAYNLAAVRIVVCSVLLGFTFATEERILHQASLGTHMLVPPFGMKSILSIFPPNAETVKWLLLSYKVLCVSALVGFGTPLSLLTTALLGTYVLGIPNFYGKVDHYHHVVWFPLILAFSRCSRVFSIDAVIFKNLNLASDTNLKSIEYALPIRIIWLCFGVIYFFPGLWKLINAGYAYIIGNNVSLMIQKNSIERGFEPILRLDALPLFSQISGLGTIVWELSFIFLVIALPYRALLASSAVLFHQGTWLMMNIDFLWHQLLLLCFLDFHQIYTYLREKCRGSLTELRQSSQSIDEGKTLSQIFKLSVVQVGALILFIEIGFGVVEKVSAWPFASFPTFGYEEGPTLDRVEISYVDSTGQEIFLSYAALGKLYGASSRHFLNHIVNLPEAERLETINDVKKALTAKKLLPKVIAELRFYDTLIDVSLSSKQLYYRKKTLLFRIV